jgi:hypothetical protein
LTDSDGLAAERVWAVIPCHLEPPSLELLREVKTHVGHIVVVEDGPVADTWARSDGVETLELGEHQGKGHAIAAGLDYVRAQDPRAEAVLLLDADGQHPVDAVPAFLAAASGAELVIGARLGDRKSMPRQRRVANALTNSLLSLVTRARITDSQCGMRLLRGRALTEVAFPRGGYEAETRHLKACLRAGVAVAWVRIPAIYPGGNSSFRPVRDGLRVLWAVFAPVRSTSDKPDRNVHTT